VLKYLGSLDTCGGGSKLGEALADGFIEANKLKFRNYSKQIYIVITDEPPHGKEFYNDIEDLEWPEGCPCGAQWDTIFQVLDTHGVDLIFVKLDEKLNQTIDKFE